MGNVLNGMPFAEGQEVVVMRIDGLDMERGKGAARHCEAKLQYGCLHSYP